MSSFKINYTGAGFARAFEYKCPMCAHECEVVQKPHEDMGGHDCPSCKGAKLQRHHTGVPALDADWHDSQKSHNLNWD